jgi:hypothetical protein
MCVVASETQPGARAAGGVERSDIAHGVATNAPTLNRLDCCACRLRGVT